MHDKIHVDKLSKRDCSMCSRTLSICHIDLTRDEVHLCMRPTAAILVEDTLRTTSAVELTCHGQDIPFRLRFVCVGERARVF